MKLFCDVGFSDDGEEQRGPLAGLPLALVLSTGLWAVILVLALWLLPT